jgi:uncharacterized protein (TIGR02145 family)
MKTKRFLSAAISIAIAFTFSACSASDDGDNGSGGGGSSYCEAQSYKTVVIGTQTWMAENLNCNVSGSVCYNDAQSNCAKYGRLYNWEAAKTVCPSGWHLPSRDEWIVLIEYVDVLLSSTSQNAGRKLKATSGWNGHNGTDEFGFAALPGGGQNTGTMGANRGVGEEGNWWSSDDTSSSNASSFRMVSSNGIIYNNSVRKSAEFSVRCVKD